MYTRYTPQPDGSFRADRIKQESSPPHTPDPPQIVHKESSPKPHRETSVDSFLRQLLPKSFDTGDLFIVLLLLLMAGDSEEGRSNALLTLALYFIM